MELTDQEKKYIKLMLSYDLDKFMLSEQDEAVAKSILSKL